MKKQQYLDLQERHQKELADFPITYAFSDQQLKEALEKLGAKREEVVSVFGHGDIIKRSDVGSFLKMLNRHSNELQEALKADHELAYAAFLYEMDNHEYAINWDGDDDIMRCFGFKMESLKELGLDLAYNMARRQHMKHAQEWGMI